MESPTAVILLLSVLVSSIHLFASGTPYFNDRGHPQDIVILEGESCKFECNLDKLQLSPNGHYYILWEFNSTSLTEGNGNIKRKDKYTFSTGTHNRVQGTEIIVKNVDISDQGIYTCSVYVKVDDGGYRALRKYTIGHLKIILKPMFRITSSNQTVVEGQNLTLHCQMERFNAEIFLVKWFLDGEGISLNHKMTNSDWTTSLGEATIVSSRKAGTFDLHMKTVQKNMGGNFQCRVYHVDPERLILQSMMATVTVIYPPDEQYPRCSPTTLQNYTEDDILETTCWAEGGNAPLYFLWTRNGIVSNGTLDTLGSMARDVWTLKITDDGHYIACTMKGPAILSERNCTIGPIRVRGVPTVTYIYKHETVAPPTFPYNATTRIDRVFPLLTGKPQPRNNSTVTNASPAVYVIVGVIGVVIFAIITITVSIVCIRRKSRKESVPASVNGSINMMNIRQHANSIDTEAADALPLISESRCFPELDVATFTADSLYAKIPKRTKLLETNSSIELVRKSHESGNTHKPSWSEENINENGEKSRNVEGLVYAELDLQRNETCAGAIALKSSQEDPSVTYAELRPPKLM